MTRRVIYALSAFALLAVAILGLARAATSPALASHDERIDAVAATLRCPTCQGLSVADSPSKVAASMRDIVGEQLTAGRTPAQVRGWFVDRYGPWILLSPPSEGLARFLWLAPVVLVTAAAGVALTVARRRRERSADDPDLAAVEKIVAEHAHGRLPVPDTPAGERLASALALLQEVRTEGETGWSSADAEHAALASVAEALENLERERVQPPVRPASDVTTPSRIRVPRGLRWAGLAGVFIAVTAGLLTTNVASRGRGDLPTGNLPGPSAQATGETQITRLREAVTSDPSDTRSRLQLAASLLRAGRIAEAEVEAERLLQRDPDNLDALVLAGIVKLQQGDPAGRRSLRRFLDTAPPDHPGRSVAEGLLNPGGSP